MRNVVVNGLNLLCPRIQASTRGSAPACRGNDGFSLVEVTIAIGIVAFAFTAVVGLLPVGMRAAEDGHEQGRATEVLNTAAAAVFGQRLLPAGELAFGDWLNDSSNPQQSPRGYAPGDPPWEESEFKVTETGIIRPLADSTLPARYSMYVRVVPPATSDGPVKVYLSVAWPGTAEWDSAEKKWEKHQGHVETLLYANLPSSF